MGKKKKLCYSVVSTPNRSHSQSIALCTGALRRTEADKEEEEEELYSMMLQYRMQLYYSRATASSPTNNSRTVQKRNCILK